MKSNSECTMQALDLPVKLIAMYLPQFHPIPENDRWWGTGFTEWTNVRKAKPLFPGHHQPHIPEQLGYYDLRDPEARAAQVELAATHGIHGFCYYHYWFNGKRLLETPFNEVLKSGEPRFPFCLCWANENWTRRWDGLDREVLMAQNYSDEDSIHFIRDLFPAFRDPRYIRVNGKPLLLIYRTSLLPDPKRTTEIWREEMSRAGMGDIYLVRVENFVMGVEDPNPADVGFDAAMEFAPYWRSVGAKLKDLSEAGLSPHGLPSDVSVFDYDHCMQAMMDRPQPDYKLFRGVFPSWDNASRRKADATLFVNSSPAKYAFWLASMLGQTIDTFSGDERLMFVNAWNEWGEGCHLEPDGRYGMSYLEATKLALQYSADYNNCRLKSSSLKGDRFDQCFTELQSLYGAATVRSSPESMVAFRVLAAVLQQGEEGSGELRQTLVRELLEKNRLTVELEECLSTVEALRNSLSWRLTAPLRALVTKLRGS